MKLEKLTLEEILAKFPDEILLNISFKEEKAEILSRFAKLLKELAGERGRYNELIFAVGKKFPNETRHETALRYIREREINQDNTTGREEREK
jgi:hypothetical protein